MYQCGWAYRFDHEAVKGNNTNCFHRVLSSYILHLQLNVWHNDGLKINGNLQRKWKRSLYKSAKNDVSVFEGTQSFSHESTDFSASGSKVQVFLCGSDGGRGGNRGCETVWLLAGRLTVRTVSDCRQNLSGCVYLMVVSVHECFEPF